MQKRQSWEIKNFVPSQDPQVPLLLDQPLPNEVDSELDRMCNGLLDHDDDGEHPRLSPLPVIDKSALADDVSIVGMSHDIDDVVDSVINTDHLPPLADLTELAGLPVLPVSQAASESKSSAIGESASSVMPQLAAAVPSPGVTYDVNNKPAVLVRLRRLTFHRYSPVETAQQNMDLSSPSVNFIVDSLGVKLSCKFGDTNSDDQSLGVISACKSGVNTGPWLSAGVDTVKREQLTTVSTVRSTEIVKQRQQPPTVNTSKPSTPSAGVIVSKPRGKSLPSAKRGSGLEKSSAVKTCVDDNSNRSQVCSANIFQYFVLLIPAVFLPFLLYLPLWGGFCFHRLHLAHSCASFLG